MPFFIALGILGLGTILALLFALPGSAREIIYGFSMSQACSILPLAAIALLVGSFRAPTAHPKFALAAGSTIILCIAMVFMLIGGIFGEPSPTNGQSSLEGATAMLTCMYVPLLALFVYFTMRAYNQAQPMLRENALNLLTPLLEQMDGEAAYADLSHQLGISEDSMDEVILDATQQKLFKGHRLAKYKRIYSSKRYVARQRQMRDIVEARGEVYLDELEHELNVPRDLLKEWIYQAVADKHFTGYINWKEEKIYSADAIRLREHGVCPNCQSKLTLGGKGVIHCEACGTDIFLEG